MCEELCKLQIHTSDPALDAIHDRNRRIMNVWKPSFCALAWYGSVIVFIRRRMRPVRRPHVLI